jgi:hypothetical protein
MRTRAPRLALLVAACLGTLVLSGCHEVLRATFGGDRPVHRVDGGASPSGPVAGAAAGRAFRGRADGELASRIKQKDGFVKTKLGPGRFIGDFKARLTGSPSAGDDALGPLAAARWYGRFTARRNRATGRIKIAGLVLADFDDATAGRACLRLKHRGKRKQHRRNAPGRSVLTVQGGEGAAETLYGTATVRVGLTSANKLRLRGRVKQRRGAARALTPACAKLKRKFKLPPVG